MLVKYIKKIQYQSNILAEMNRKLEAANVKTKDTMRSLVELYQAVHLLTSKQDRQSVLRFFIQYAKNLVKTDRVYYYTLSEELKGMMSNKEELPSLLIRSLEHNVLERLDELKNKDGPVETECCGGVYLLIPVRSIHKLFGILCIEKSASEDSKRIDVDYGEQMRVFIKLYASVLEKFEFEELKNRLIISEEQNRIANEIHDGVLQRLFSISCGLFSLSKRLSQMRHNQIDEELHLIRQSIDNVMRELREKIYGMSWKKNGENAFERCIKDYFTELKNMHRIDVEFNLFGNLELITVFQKKAVYRIICEGLGNAIRHGNAQKMTVLLNITPSGTQLKITDDGLGFKVDSAAAVKGLGIRNIQLLADSMKGTATINSNIGLGTEVEVFLPFVSKESFKEEIV
jgi:signal transduction histidine kinase